MISATDLYDEGGGGRARLRYSRKNISTLGLVISAIVGGLPLPAEQNADIPKPLKAYTSCHFSDGLQIRRVDPLAPGVTARTVDTAEGPKQIDMEAGIRVMFAYPFTDFYANVKVELLPEKTWPQLKRDLLASFAYTQSHTSGSVINDALPKDLHNFETRGEDRNKLEGGVLGLYLLFDDQTHVVTTIYFLNQESMQRKFQSIEEYQLLRNQFLTTYTGCIRENQAILR